MQCGGHICSGIHANNVKFMYTRAPGYSFYFNEFQMREIREDLDKGLEKGH